MAREFRVSGPAGALCVVSLADGATVLGLREAIRAETGIQPLSQRLFHGLQELTPSNGLDGFETGVVAEILLVRRSSEQTTWLQAVCTLQPWEVSRWLERSPAAAREDREVCLAAVAKDGYALRYAAQAFHADSDVVCAAVSKDGCALHQAAPAIQADRKVVLTAVRQDGHALRYAAPELRADREVVLAAVATDGGALRHVAPELQADRIVVLAATAMDGSALHYAAKELRA